MMSGLGSFLDRVFLALQMRGYTSDWNAEQFADAVIRWSSGPAVPPPMPSVAVEVTDVTTINIPDHILIHEMLKRGYAVMRTPTNTLTNVEIPQ